MLTNCYSTFVTITITIVCKQRQQLQQTSSEAYKERTNIRSAFKSHRGTLHTMHRSELILNPFRSERLQVLLKHPSSRSANQNRRCEPQVTGGHYVFGQNSNHCSWTLCNHIDMKSGMHDQCYFLFLGAEVQHHRSAVPVRSTRALPGPFHHCSRHLLLKENLDNAVLVARLLIRVDFPFS